MDPATLWPRCCTTPSRTPRTPSTRCAATSATRSPCSSTASPSWTRSSSARPRRPRPCARWSSRWPRTSGSWSSSSPTGCTTCAPCATSSPAKQEKKARETLEIYAPLAHRLGMNTIKWELEDLAFAILYPKMYDEIVRLVAERAPKRDEYLARVIDEVHGRPAGRADQGHRHRPAEALLLVYQKMIVRGRDFAEIYDLVGIRVLVDTVRDCYAALGTIHARWNPVPGRFKDYIAMPKFNMYQSLHTTVIGPERQAGRAADPHLRHAPPRRVRHRRALEVQGGRRPVGLRRREPAGQGRDLTGRGQRHGVAAPAARLAEGDRGPGRVPRSRCASTSSRNEVFVFTPKGDVIALPAGATPVDFAYAVHTEVGHRTHRRAGQRPPGAAGVARSTTATWSRSSPPRRRAPGRPATG